MKIGILTSGGDTPGMNAVIRAAYIQCQNLGHELVGVRYGWKGLMENITMKISDNIVDQIDLGGTILGSARRNPYSVDHGVESIRKTFEANRFDCVIAIGGEDTLGVAHKLTNDGLPMIGVPKTIDNDLDATDYTFGFNTAITIATEAIDRLKTTAKSHERVIVVEIMGRHAGWMTLHAGLAGGAHVILVPEYKMSIDKIAKIIENRYKKGKTWAIIAVSEGYGFDDKDTEDLETDEFGHVRLEKVGIGQELAERLEKRTGITTRSVVLGHTQRGGPPSAFDRVLCTQLGLTAVNLADQKDFGKMPSLQGTEVLPVPLSDAVAKLKVITDEHWQYALDIMQLNH